MTTRFEVLQEWTGFVVESKALAAFDFGKAKRDPTGNISVEGVMSALDVTARLQDVTDPGRVEEIADFRVPMPDDPQPGHSKLIAHLMVPGAQFRWRIGYAWDAKGTRRRYSEITAIGGEWTAEEIEQAKREAEFLTSALMWSRGRSGPSK